MITINTSKKFLISICILLIFTLSACKQSEQSHEDGNSENEQQDITYSFKNPNTEQEFNIIHAYLLYENYFATVKNHPDEPLSKLFQQEVITPVNEACFRDAELADSLTLREMITKRSDFDHVKNQIESMNKDQLNEVFEESLVNSSDILPSNEQTTVCIFPENKNFPSDMATIGSGKIIVFYDRFHNYFKSGMSHEYHHSVWLGNHLTDSKLMTGLDQIVLEGQAVMFETFVYPNLNNMYALLDERFNKEYWSKMEPYLKNIAGAEIQEIILGGSNGFPNAYGYSEGYKIVRSYLDMHPDMSVEEWTSKDPTEIFEDVNYIANYQ